MSEMSREDEIIKLLKKYDFNDKARRYFDPYKAVANDIIALFEVEGKVEYVVKYYNTHDKVWCDFYSHDELIRVRDAMKQRLLLYPKYKFRIIKRTTTDQIIEENK